jgi:hypothetical protein
MLLSIGIASICCALSDAALAHHLLPGAASEIVKLFTHWIAKTFQVRIPARFQEAQGPRPAPPAAGGVEKAN